MQQQSDPKSIIIALALATGIIFLFQSFFAVEQPKVPLSSTNPQTTDFLPVAQAAVLDRAEVITNSPRVQVRTPALNGSINLTGALIDDMQLIKHRETIALDSQPITLFSPKKTKEAYYAWFSWLSNDDSIILPNETTAWNTSGDTLTPKNPVTLSWNNGQDIIFKQQFSIDENYLIQVNQFVENASAKAIEIYPYAAIQQANKPEGRKIVYHGPMIGLQDKLQEISYKKLSKKKAVKIDETGGWIGFGGHYWLSALIPPQNAKATYRAKELMDGTKPAYQVEYVVISPVLAAGKTQLTQQRLFAGAKNVGLIDNYQQDLNLPNFSRSIDFGWFYFIAKPLFSLLHWLFLWVGNYGWAIVLLTIIIRAVMLPFTYKSYKSMAQLKEIQPKMKELQDKYGDDRMKLSQEMMALYKKEKVNPMSGCLPILIQLPIFFALYKTLLISLEMRHAPFFGWIQDLAAADPLFILTGFNTIDIPLFEFLEIGVWPALVALTMFISQKMNPQPTDKTQALMFNLFPVVFLFISAHMPVGLCVYWTVSNICTIAQQQFIRKKMDARHGAKKVDSVG